MKLAVTIPEAAAMIGISESMLWRLLADSEIFRIKIGRRTVIRVTELERFLESHTQPHKQVPIPTNRREHDEFLGRTRVSSPSPTDLLRHGGPTRG